MVVLLLIMAPPLTYAGRLAVSLETLPGAVEVTARVEDYAGPSLLNTVHEGLRAEVRYNLRVYRRATGITGLLGDTLIAEYNPSHLAEWDPFGRVYRVIRQDGTEVRSVERERYLEAFFTLESFALPARLFENGGSYYVICRAAVVPVKLVPALGLLAVFTDRSTEYTDWVRVAIPERVVDR